MLRRRANTQWAKEVGIIRDEEGDLVTGPDLRKFGTPGETWKLNREPYYLETSMPGVFAAGDVRHGSIKRGFCCGRRRYRDRLRASLPRLGIITGAPDQDHNGSLACHC